MKNAWGFPRTRIATELKFTLEIAMSSRQDSAGNGTLRFDRHCTNLPLAVKLG